MDIAIRTRGLTKRYGRTTALDALDLTVPAGTVFGYLGPNGAGKTTTLRLLAGLLRPTSGSAQVLGHDVVASRREVQRAVGHLPGDFVAYRHLTGREYLRYLADLRGDVSWSEAELCAKRLDLDLDRTIGTLSHGNRQKVGLVQAFMPRPPVLVLDEPTAGLDPLVQRAFRSMVREARDAGRTVLLSSHVLSEVEAIADTVGILRAGHLVAVEDVAGLRDRALRHVDVTFAGTPPLAALQALPGVHLGPVQGHTVSLTVEGSMEALWRVAGPQGVVDVRSQEADLEQLFLRHYDSGGA